MPMMQEAKNLAQRLRMLREEAELSQQELANKAGLSLSIVVQLERGTAARGAPTNPRLETLFCLARALGVRVEKLIAEE